MRISVVLLCSLLVMSCSSLPPKTNAIHNALVTDAALRNAFSVCGELGGEQKRIAFKEQTNWWRRNNAYVLAADYGVLALNWDMTSPKNETQRAVLAMQILEYIQADAMDQQQKWFGKLEEADECDRLFRAVNKGKYDLSKPRKKADVLMTIYNERQATEEDAQAARSINNRYRKYGRSLFVVEKSLNESGCTNPKISMLRNSWPIEVFDAVCSERDYVLVKCDWGRCEVKR